MEPQSMSAQELRAEIEATRRRAEAEDERFRELEGEIDQAWERQRLRDELHAMQRRLRQKEARNDVAIQFRGCIDNDEERLNLPPSNRKPPVMHASGGESAKFDDMVAKGEYVWRIEGFSWVPCALKQKGFADGDPPSVEASFFLGNQRIYFSYSPWADWLCYQHYGSLAIVLFTEEYVALRYRIYVKARDGQFVQWGETRDVVHRGFESAYGPDVHWPGHPPASLGIFGLSHEELLQSEWVQNDTLTVKFELEVRPDKYGTWQRLSLAAEVPEPTIIEDTRALLTEGTCSDVRIMVQDEVIHAHSQVLCARSEVFRKQLTAGMQESLSRVIVIEDCDVATFKAFLRFLYTDHFPEVKDFAAAATSSNDEAEHGSLKVSPVQSLLSVSNKYQVTRLQLWCEARLSEQVDTAQVCGILCQAHLLQAKQLEKACLSFIKDHAAQVLTLPAYVELVKKWPQIGVKVSLFSAGVSDTELSTAMACMEKPRGQESEQEQASSEG